MSEPRVDTVQRFSCGCSGSDPFLVLECCGVWHCSFWIVSGLGARKPVVLSIAFIAHDGATNWMEGVQLLAVYMILSLGFFFLPG